MFPFLAIGVTVAIGFNGGRGSLSHDNGDNPLLLSNGSGFIDGRGLLFDVKGF